MRPAPPWAEPARAAWFHPWRAAGLLALFLLMQAVGLRLSNRLAEPVDVEAFASAMRWDGAVFLLATSGVVAAVQRFGRIGWADWGVASLAFLAMDAFVQIRVAPTPAPVASFLPTVGAVVGAALAVGWRGWSRVR